MQEPEPQSNPFRPLSPSERDGLRKSIERFGVLMPVMFDPDGNIIDGNHRHAIATELGITYPQCVCAPDADPAEIARTLNIDRRHLSKEERQAFVEELRAEGHSTRAIAIATGVSQTQVLRDLDHVNPTVHVTPDPPVIALLDDDDASATVNRGTLGVDGKWYPAKTKKPKAPKPEPAHWAELHTAVLKASRSYIESQGWEAYEKIVAHLAKSYGPEATP